MTKYSKEYKEYLKSPEWRRRRTAKLQQARWRCQKCPETEGLQVHHLTYERLGHEDAEDLIVLCRACHWVADEIRKNPNSALAKKYYAPPKPKTAGQRRKEKTEREKGRGSQFRRKKKRKR